MKDVQLRQLHRNTAEYADKEIVVRGWVRTNRSSNKFGFIELNDGTFFKSVQIVYEADKIENFDAIVTMTASHKAMLKSVVNSDKIVTIAVLVLMLALDAKALLYVDYPLLLTFICFFIFFFLFALFGGIKNASVLLR